MSSVVRFLPPACAVAVFSALAVASPAAAAPDERLPNDVVPLHYVLGLHPHADTLKFEADVSIDIDVRVTTRDVVLNAVGLDFDAVTVDGKLPAQVTLDATLERASLHVAAPLEPGAHRLAIRYHGLIQRGTRGFFAWDYESRGGKGRPLPPNSAPPGAEN